MRERDRERERKRECVMEMLVSHRLCRGSVVPEAYVFSEEQRPTSVSTNRSIPIIDLEEGSEDEVVKEILNAAKDYGVFKVINHGIPEQLIDDVISVAQEFFEMPVEDKAPYYSEDPMKETRLFTGQGFRKENIHFWRDCLIMSAYPVEKYEHQFPEKPDNLRRIMGKFVPEGRKLVRRLLELISKGLGLEEDYLTGDISEGSMKMVFNYYPPCPDPSLTLGLPKHCDITLINLLLQGNVSGLQVLHDDQWISVDPLPNSFVVNFGLLLEVISNGLLKAVEHRAVTNKNVARTSIAMAIRSTDDCIICPAEVLVSEEHSPPVYRSFRFPDLFEVFSTKNADDKEIMMKDFMIKN